MPDRKPAARRSRGASARAELTPLEFMKRVYREPIPDGISIAERIKIVTNQLNAAKHAAAIEIRLGQANGEGDLAALLRELEGTADAND